MGGVPTTLRRTNKVDPKVSKVECKETKEKSSTAVSIERRDGNVLWERSHQKWEAFDIDVSQNRPKKPPCFFRDGPTASSLTKEQIFVKQGHADKNRMQFLESKKKTAFRLSEIRNCKNDEEERLIKSTQLAKKLAKATENRNKQLENIKTAAKNSRGIINSSPARVKAEKTFLELEKKMSTMQENRQRIVNDVVKKQKLREEHAQKVRGRVSIDYLAPFCLFYFSVQSGIIAYISLSNRVPSSYQFSPREINFISLKLLKLSLNISE